MVNRIGNVIRNWIVVSEASGNAAEIRARIGPIPLVPS